ncbi:MAG: hypothetical protein U1F98_06225 [Verrucomicrobiota bacterium]
MECIDAATGESPWLYRFQIPAPHDQFLFPGDALTLVEAEAAFRSDNAHPATAGLQVIGGKSGKPRPTSDPAPSIPTPDSGKDCDRPGRRGGSVRVSRRPSSPAADFFFFFF